MDKTESPRPSPLELTQAPHMAIVQDDSFEMPAYRVYLVNPTSRRATAVYRDTGGYEGSDTLIEATSDRASLGALEPSSSLPVSLEDVGSFDFAVWWNLTLVWEDGTAERLHFSVPKWFPMRSGDAVWTTLEVLGGEGWVLAPEKTRVLGR